MSKPINIEVELSAEELRKKLNIQDGKDAPPVDTDKLAKDTAKIVIEEVKKDIPNQKEIEDNLSKLIPKADDIKQSVMIDVPKLVEPIRDGLEKLDGENRLDISAIKGLDDYDEVARLAKEPKVVKKYYGGGGGSSSGGGAVDSVNGQTGVVVLDADDIDDTSTTNKFVTATDITNLGNLSGTNTGDQVGDGVTITGTGTVGDPFVATGGTWGSITGTLSDQTDLQSALDAKANIAGGNTFTGIQILDTVKAGSSAGITVESNSGTDVALFGAGGGAGATFYGGVNIDGQTRLATSLNGLAKMTSGVVSAAVADTDYLLPATAASTYIPLTARPATDISSTGEYLIVDEPSNVTDASYSSVGTVIGQWDINGDTSTTAIDDSSNANNGTYQGSLGQTNDANGIVGKYINLDGSNDYISIPNLAAYNAIPISWAFNIRIPNTAPASYDGLIEKYATGSLNGYLIFLNTVGQVGFFYLRGSVSNAINEGLLSNPLMDGAWHRVVVALDSSGAEMFVDGVSVDTQAWTGTQGGVTTTETLKIGAHPSFSRYSLCAMDEIVVYSQKLNSTQALADAKIALQQKLMDGRGYYQIGNGGWGNIRLNAETLTLLDKFKIRNTTANKENVIGLDTIDGADDQSAIVTTFDVPISGNWSNRGAYFGMRGNEYTSYANQRGHLFFVAGNPGSAGTYDGGIAFYTGNEVVRMHIHRDGQIRMPIGTAAAPSLTEHTDTNTGMTWLGSDVLTFSTGGVERLRIDATGNTTATASMIATSSVTATAPFSCTHTSAGSSGASVWAFKAIAPNIVANSGVLFLFGRAESLNNSTYFNFKYAGAGSTSNAFQVGFYANDNLFNFYANGNFGIGTGVSLPTQKLDVVGSIAAQSSALQTAPLIVQNTTVSSSTYPWVFEGLTPNISAGAGSLFLIGRAKSTNNSAYMAFKYVGAGSTSNAYQWSFYGNDNLMSLLASGNLGIGVGNNTISARIHGISTTEQLRLGYDTINYFSTTVGSTGGVTFNAVGSGAGFTFSDSVTMEDAQNIIFNTTTGTKIGTATGQKIGFWNATPIIQPTTAVTAATFVANTSGIVDDTATFDGYTIGQVVKALRNAGLLA